jgi:hypothetical protein
MGHAKPLENTCRRLLKKTAACGRMAKQHLVDARLDDDPPPPSAGNGFGRHAPGKKRAKGDSAAFCFPTRAIAPAPMARR